MVAEKNQRYILRRDHSCVALVLYMCSVVATNRGAGDYWLGTCTAMLRAFGFDSSVHVMRLMLLRAVTVDPIADANDKVLT